MSQQALKEAADALEQKLSEKATGWSIYDAVSNNFTPEFIDHYLQTAWDITKKDVPLAQKTVRAALLVYATLEKRVQSDTRQAAQKMIKHAKQDPDEYIRSLAFLGQDKISANRLHVDLENVSQSFGQALEKLKTSLSQAEIRFYPKEMVYLDPKVVDSYLRGGYDSIAEHCNEPINLTAGNRIPPREERLKQYKLSMDEMDRPLISPIITHRSQADISGLNPMRRSSYMSPSGPNRRSSEAGAPTPTRAGFKRESKVNVMKLDEVDAAFKKQQEQEEETRRAKQAAEEEKLRAKQAAEEERLRARQQREREAEEKKQQ
ncbi:hypothetical protein HK104_002802, partial [Borealophlyctis nickersoniae]